MPRRDLTQRQKDFCRKYLEMKDATQAYLASYNTDSARNAQIESARLLQREDIQIYLQKLQAPAEKAVAVRIISDREKKKQLIMERIERCMEKDDDTAIARYVEILNKMDGEYVNISKDITDHNPVIHNLSTEMLERIAKA